MSIGVLSWRTDVYDADSMVETAVRAELVCDTIADLPLPTYVTGYRLIIGSKAYIVADGTEYMLNSSGQWILQRSADIAALVADISQIEDQLQDTTADAAWAKDQIDDYIMPALISLIDRGAKNALDLSAAQTTTDNGVTFTMNNDYSITITGAAIAPNNGWFVVPVTVPDGVYIFSGMPADGGTASYRQEIRATPRGTVIGINDSQSGNQITISSGGATIYYHIRAASGYNFGTGVIVKPMLSQQKQYVISDAYVPFSPTNRQLYELIKSYHP